MTQTTIPTIDRLNAPSAVTTPSPFAELGAGDFLKLLTVQLQQQDPLEPVDNKDMLAQMAQFSTLANGATTNDRLADIAAKLDALVAAQEQTQTSPTE